MSNENDATQGKLTRIIFIWKSYENHTNSMRKGNTYTSCEKNVQFSCEKYGVIMQFSYLLKPIMHFHAIIMWLSCDYHANLEKPIKYILMVQNKKQKRLNFLRLFL